MFLLFQIVVFSFSWSAPPLSNAGKDLELKKTPMASTSRLVEQRLIHIVCEGGVASGSLDSSGYLYTASHNLVSCNGSIIARTLVYDLKSQAFKPRRDYLLTGESFRVSGTIAVTKSPMLAPSQTKDFSEISSQMCLTILPRDSLLSANIALRRILVQSLEKSPSGIPNNLHPIIQAFDRSVSLNHKEREGLGSLKADDLSRLTTRYQVWPLDDGLIVVASIPTVTNYSATSLSNNCHGSYGSSGSPLVDPNGDLMGILEGTPTTLVAKLRSHFGLGRITFSKLQPHPTRGD